MSIAGRLESLIASAERLGRGAMDTQHIAALTQELGHPLTSSYVTQLRRGSRTNPTIDSLRVLAAVFDVPVSYFFPSDTAPDDPTRSPSGAETSSGRAGAGQDLAGHGGRSGSLAASSLPATLAELFERSRDEEGRPLDVDEVARRCQASGCDVTASYLSDLCSGMKDNPSIKTLEGIAAAFGVHVSFFFAGPARVNPDHDAAQADWELSEAMKDEGVREIALRSSALDPAGRRILAAMLRELSEVKVTRHDPVPPPGMGNE